MLSYTHSNSTGSFEVPRPQQYDVLWFVENMDIASKILACSPEFSRSSFLKIEEVE